MKLAKLIVGDPRFAAKPPSKVRPPTSPDEVTRGTNCATFTNTAETTHSTALPSGAQAGDLCFMLITTEGGPITTPPPDWDEEYSVNAGSFDYAYCYSKTLTSSDIASPPTFDQSAGDDSAGLSVYFRGAVRADLTLSGPVGMTTAEHDPPPVTPAQGAGDYFVIVIFHENKGSFPTDQQTDGPTGYTAWCEIKESADVLAPAVHLWYAEKTIATSENPSEINWSDSIGSRTYANATISIPIQAAAGDVATGSHLHGAENATDGQVWTADGAGSAAWEDPAGGIGDHDSLTGVSADDHHTEDHAARHASGGADAVTPAAIGASATGHTHTESQITDLDHWIEADHDALDHTGLTGVGASASDSHIWRPLLDGVGGIVTDDDGAAVMGYGPA